MNKVGEVFNRNGVWIFMAGAFCFFLSLNFSSSMLGIAFIVIGGLALCSDPIILLAGHFSRKGKDTTASIGLAGIDKILLLAWGVMGAALVFYLLRGALNLPLEKVNSGDEPFAARLRTLFLTLFIISFISSLALRLVVSLAFDARNTGRNVLELVRLQGRNRAVLSVLAMLMFLGALNYASHLRNPVLDLSPGYFSFSEEGRTVIRSVQANVRIYAFLPVQQFVNARSAVRRPETYRIAEDVRNMLEQLPIINSRLKLEFKNADLDSAELSDFGTVNNGTIVFRVLKTGSASALDDKPYVERRIHVYSEKDMDKLERNAVRALIHVSSPAKTIYFAASNGERFSFEDKTRDQDGIGTFKDALRFFNYNLKTLDHTTAWPGPVPKDASMIALIGPSLPYGKIARKALIDYVAAGGRLFITAEPDGKEDFSWLLQKLSSRQFAMRNDFLSYPYRGALVTDSFPAHRITDNILGQGSKLVLLPRMGHFAKVRAKKVLQKKGASGGVSALLRRLKSHIILNSSHNAFIDLNRNGRKDGKEKNQRFHLGLAFDMQTSSPRKDKKNSGTTAAKGISKKKDKGPRLVFYSGTNWLTNRILSGRTRLAHKNAILALDSMLWLTENPLVASIQPRKRRSRAVQVTDSLKIRNMILGMILFPGLTAGLVALGVYVYRRRRRPFTGNDQS